MIHPTAVVSPRAVIADGAEIGAYAVIDDGVEIGAGTRIGPHAVIRGPTRIGRGNRVFQFCSIGDDPQDRKYAGEPDSRLEIGDDNVLREFCSVNRGTAGGGGVTRIGNGNWIMACVHIAHDCQVGSNVIMANNTALAGHVSVDDHAILGGFTAVHQFCRIGRHSFTAIASVVVKDIPPYTLVAANPARPNGLNKEGLRRHGFSADQLRLLDRAYRIVYREGLLLRAALEQLDALAAQSPEVAAFAGFIRASERGIVR